MKFKSDFKSFFYCDVYQPLHCHFKYLHYILFNWIDFYGSVSHLVRLGYLRRELAF